MCLGQAERSVPGKHLRSLQLGQGRSRATLTSPGAAQWMSADVWHCGSCSQGTAPLTSPYEPAELARRGEQADLTPHTDEGRLLWRATAQPLRAAATATV